LAGGFLFEPAAQDGHQIGLSGVQLRVAKIDELDILCDIDLDASRLFERAGLYMASPNDLELAAAERSRWLDCLRSGTTLLAGNRSGESLGFVALAALDGEPYLEQLSVRMHAMRHGMGTALLTAAAGMAEKARGRSLWLTTYRHLPWNGPFYEKAGFAVVPAEEWGNDMTREVLFHRGLLPKPEERVVMRKSIGAFDRYSCHIVRARETRRS
jgi:GNAT superfamily N-acetyltransferase